MASVPVGGLYVEVGVEAKGAIAEAEALQVALRGVQRQLLLLNSSTNTRGVDTALAAATARARATQTAIAAANSSVLMRREIDAAQKVANEQNKIYAAQEAQADAILAKRLRQEQALEVAQAKRYTKQYAQAERMAAEQARAAERAAAAEIAAAEKSAAAQARLDDALLAKKIRNDKLAAASRTGALKRGGADLATATAAAGSGNLNYAAANSAQGLIKLTGAFSDMTLAAKAGVVALGGVAVATAAAGAAAGIAAVKLASYGAEQAANLEMLNIQLSGLLGSAEKGKQEMDFLLELGKTSIVPTESLIQADRLMLAFGVTVDKTRQNLVTFMSDFGTATGATEQQTYFLSLALGQVAALGKANMIDMRQLANAGINTMQVYEIIGKNIGMSAREVAAGVSEGLVTADRLFEALEEYGAGYAETAERARNSTQGILANLKDVITIELGRAFEGINEGISSFLGEIYKIMETIDFSKFAAGVQDAMKMVGDALGGGTEAGNTLKTLLEETLPTAIRVLGAAAAAIIVPLRLLWQAFQAISNVVGSVVKFFTEVKVAMYALVGVVGVWTAGLISQNAALIIANTQLAIYKVQMGAASIAANVATGAVARFTAGLAAMRVALTAALGPISIIVGVLIGLKARLEEVDAAAQEFAAGEKTVSETMTEHVGIAGQLAVGLANLRSVIDNLRGTTEEATVAQEGNRSAISGTVQAAIDAGNAMGGLAAETSAAGGAAWYATQSYYALAQSIAAAARSRWEYNNTSGTVSSAIMQGMLNGPDGKTIYEYNKRWPAPKIGGGSTGSTGSSSAAKKENPAIQKTKDLIALWKELVDVAKQGQQALFDAFNIPFLKKQPGATSDAFKAFSSGDVDTIVGQYKTLRQAIQDFYTVAEAKGGKRGKKARSARRENIAFLKEQTGELIALADDSARAQKVFEDAQKKFDDLTATISRNRDAQSKQYADQQKKISKQYDGYYTATSATDGSFFEGSIAVAERALSAATAAYDAAKSKLDDLLAARKAFMDSLQSMAISFVNDLSKVNQEVTKFTRLDEVGSFSSVTQEIADTQSFTQGLKERLQALKDFASNIKSLIASGLDQGLVQQLVQAGPEQAGAIAKALAGASAGEIADINKVQADLAATIAGMQQEASAAWFDAGIAAQEAFTSPLKAAMDAAQANVDNLNYQKDLALGILEAWNADQQAMYDQQQADAQAALDAANALLEETLLKNQEEAEKIATAIEARLTKLPKTAYAAGLDTIDGLIQGLSDDAKLKELKRAARAMAQVIADTVKSTLKISSPSQVMVEAGQNVGEGLAIGMGMSEPTVASAAASMAGSAIPGLSGAGGNTMVKVYIGDQELRDIVDVQIGQADETSAGYVLTGRRL